MEFILCGIAIVFLLRIFYDFYPPFGGKSPTKQWQNTPNHTRNQFQNQISTDMNITFRDMQSLIRQQLRRGTSRQPKQPVKAAKIDIAGFLRSKTPQLIWLGHSSVMLRIGGKTILTDPILSKRSSPFSFIGPKRTISQLPITAKELPAIDMIIISHDHYDHLDYGTIRALRHKTSMFYVPLGVAAHLETWGVPKSKITELDWWESKSLDGYSLTCTPARHFSGRKIGDRFKTLWCSWVIEIAGVKVFFSGDTGYGPHFKEIGRKFGPFDLTLMECGQYDKLWPDIHMIPEDTVRAHQDLGGKRLFPIHWGAFVLALHPWRDSVRRAEKATRQSKVHLLSAEVGAMTAFITNNYADPPWWDIQS